MALWVRILSSRALALNIISDREGHPSYITAWERREGTEHAQTQSTLRPIAQYICTTRMEVYLVAFEGCSANRQWFTERFFSAWLCDVPHYCGAPARSQEAGRAAASIHLRELLDRAEISEDATSPE